MQTMEAELDIMVELKSSTAQQHKAVELLMPFFRERFSLAEYACTLQAFLGFFEPMEASLRGALEGTLSEIELNRRKRAHLLRADLLALGVSLGEIARLPRCRELPEIRNRFAGLGCMYVLEGSTLGGQLIGRELGRRFGIDARSGASFFLSHGTQAGERWKEFCATVRTHVTGPDGRARALQAASATFTSLQNWMGEADRNV